LNREKKLIALVRFRFYKPETEKTEPNRTQTEKTRKKIIEKIESWKKPIGLVRFRFYKPETKKSEPNRIQTEQNRKKPSQNRAKPVWTGFFPKKLNRTEPKPVSLNQFRVFLKSIWLLFFIKTEPNRKWSPLTWTLPRVDSLVRF
jgi:hypothetical protein